jgi:hypothetical protein
MWNTSKSSTLSTLRISSRNCAKNSGKGFIASTRFQNPVICWSQPWFIAACLAAYSHCVPSRFSRWKTDQSFASTGLDNNCETFYQRVTFGRHPYKSIRHLIGILTLSNKVCPKPTTTTRKRSILYVWSDIPLVDGLLEPTWVDLLELPLHSLISIIAIQWCNSYPVI